eukprot:Skav228359  [mRNA]  locus=scaffold1981:32625:32933:+ [translate_table: standard]
MFQVFRDTKAVEMLLTWELGPNRQAVLRSSVGMHQRRAMVEEMLQDVDGAEETDPCCICLEEAEEEVAQLHCGHRFHKKCVKEWLTLGDLRCPMCNSGTMRS